MVKAEIRTHELSSKFRIGATIEQTPAEYTFG